MPVITHIYSRGDQKIPETIYVVHLYTTSPLATHANNYFRPCSLNSALMRRCLKMTNIHLLLRLEVSRDDTTARLAAEIVIRNEVLDTQDMAAMAHPMEEGITKDINESDKRHNIRDSCASHVGNGALDRREDSAAGNTLDHDTSTAPCVHP